MKLNKLNRLGVAHLIAPLLIVVGIAIAGSLALVLSHAQSCTPVSGVVSSPTSSPITTCTPTSSPTSSPTLVKGGPCYLGKRGVNNGIIVLNPNGAKGNCAQYSNGAIYYTGVSGKNVLCTASTKMHNGVYVCIE